MVTLPSGPSATVTVSPPLSSVLSGVVVNTSVAVCAAAPEKRTFGVAVVAPERVTPVLRPVPVFSARLQSSVVTFVPETDSGTSMISPATSARPRVTVNSTVPPSVTALLLPTRARLTTVGSSSVTVIVSEDVVCKL